MMEPANHEADIPLEGAAAFAGLTVGDLMTHHVHTVTRDDRLDDMHALMRMTGTRHLPVMAGDDPASRLVGIVTESDFLAVAARALANVTNGE